MTDAILVFVTLPDAAQAATLARSLVEAQLAACGNILPGVRSIYSWKGQLTEDVEVLLLLKSRAPLFDDLRKRIVASHPYQCPEVLQVNIAAGHAPYLDWIFQNTQPRT